MKLTDRQYALLLNAVSVMVEVAHMQDSTTPKVNDLAVFNEAQQYCIEQLSKDATVTFGEIDDLFSTLLKIASTHNLSDRDQDLASLPPTSNYIH